MAEKPYCHEFPEKRNFGIAMNLAYRCADGEWIRCTIFEYDRYAHKFYEALDVTEQMASLGVTSLPIMMEKAESIVPIYERVFATKPSSEWLKIFSDLDIVCGRLNHFGDVLEDQQAWANEYLQTYRCTNGAERILPTAPVRFGSQGALKVGKPVMFGENNQEVLAALGYSLEEIQKISDAGALG